MREFWNKVRPMIVILGMAALTFFLVFKIKVNKAQREMLDFFCTVESADAIDADGNLELPVTAETLAETGFEVGDMVYVSFGDFVELMPILPDNSYADGTGLCLVMSEEDNSANLLLEQKDARFEEYCEISFPVDVRITRVEAGGYLRQLGRR